MNTALVCTEYVGGWAPEQGWMLWTTDKHLAILHKRSHLDCKCAWTSHFIKTRVIKYHHHTQQYRPQKLIVVKHEIGAGHQILLNNASFLSRISSCMYQLIREAIEMKLHANNIHQKTVLSHADHYSFSSVLITVQSKRHSLAHDSLTPPEMLLP